ncbi:MAG: hypothetical protein JWM07_53 [Candidatus Saccharibacteria bacterium]|jgi:hypothetical protein|nr:hypothetical protein [Candidatus Saccharibacteria bacterium]
MLHHIQKSILDTLATVQLARYSDIKPHDIDGNIFSYHLKLLVADHYAIKNEDGLYSLSPKGKDHIVHRYENPLYQAHSIFLIAIRRGDEWLMRERLIQPLLGMSGFIHGEPVAGEPLLETAMRRLQVKTGMDVPLSIHSSGLIRISHGGIMESFSHAIILTADTNESLIIQKDETGRNYWLPSVELQKANILPSCPDIISLLAQAHARPFEFDYRL